jgi:hypothetical protein
MQAVVLQKLNLRANLNLQQFKIKALVLSEFKH